MAKRSSKEHAALDVARALEQTASTIRSVRAHLEHGPAKKQRRKARKQLAKLTRAIDGVQLSALGRKASRELASTVDDVLPRLDECLEDTLYHEPDAERLKALRKAAKSARKALAPWRADADHEAA